MTADSLAPQLRALLAAWRERHEALGRLPKPDEIVAAFPKDWRYCVALIAPGARSGFVVETCGFDLIRRFGRFAGGQRVAALAPGIGRALGARLLLALRTRTPVIWRPEVLLGRDPTRFGELILPLSEDGARISLLLLAALEERRARMPSAAPPLSRCPSDPDGA